MGSAFCNGRPLLAMLGLALVAFGALASDLLDAEARWKYLQGSDDAGSYVRFLFEHPDSPHVAEARAVLAARDNAPLGRLVDPGAACATTVQARAQEMLARAPVPEMRGRYLLTVPAGHFLASPELVVVPTGQTVAQAPIEQRITLSLVAARDGTCTLYERWGHGSGLGAACRCVPQDSAYRFRSALADGILADVARMRAGNAACAASGTDESAEIAGFRQDVLTVKRARLQRLRSRAQALYPSERQELDDIEYALPFLETGEPPRGVEERERARIASLPPEILQRFCTSALPADIARAREAVMWREAATP